MVIVTMPLGAIAHRFSESIAARFREQTAFEFKSKIRSSPDSGERHTG
jgi:hypothetical protein